MVRTGCKISTRDLPDERIELLMTALDEDGEGTISAKELHDFMFQLSDSMKSEIQHRFRAALKDKSPAEVFAQWVSHLGIGD